MELNILREIKTLYQRKNTLKPRIAGLLYSMNALREELEDSTVANFATVQKEGEREVERNIEYYNLDMIISVGYRVKSKRGVEFRNLNEVQLLQILQQLLLVKIIM